jgi:hypothetical protein
MKEFKLQGLIEEAIAKFAQNRSGPRPSVLAKIPPDLPLVSWRDDGLPRFIKSFLYQALTANNPETPVRISVNERARLSDLEAFVRILPLCWLQLRIEGRGPGMSDKTIEELFREFGYRSEEWVGVEGSTSQLAIFSPWGGTEPKVVFCLNTARPVWKCDVLIPVADTLMLPIASNTRRKA